MLHYCPSGVNPPSWSVAIPTPAFPQPTTPCEHGHTIMIILVSASPRVGAFLLFIPERAWQVLEIGSKATRSWTQAPESRFSARRVWGRSTHMTCPSTAPRTRHASAGPVLHHWGSGLQPAAHDRSSHLRQVSDRNPCCRTYQCSPMKDNP